MPRTSFTSLISGAVLLAALSAPGQPPTPSPVPSPAAVRAEFEAACAAVRGSANPFYGKAQVGELEKRLAAGELAAAERVRLLVELGQHQLRLGAPERSVATLNEALRVASGAGLEKVEMISILARLGVAAMRAGEVRNCVAAHSPGMCILPIGPGGRHQDPQGSLMAIRAFEGVLAGIPDYPLVPWLLNVAAMTVGRYPDGVPERYRVPPERMRSDHDVGRFVDVASDVGLHVHDVSGGAVVEDFDGDGLLDVVTSSAEPCTPMRYFRNDGRGGFEDRAAAAGLDAQLGGINLVQADYDGDGHVDLLVLRGGWMGREGRVRNSLLRNRGDGTFDDVTERAGLARPAYPTQTAAWADYDSDGDLDLYVGNEGDAVSEPVASQLFENRGDGTFRDVAARAGVENRRYTKGVAWGDVDNDGDPDLYVSTFGRNRLYRNRGDGTFEDVAPELGLEAPSEQSFGTFFFDFDNDGWLDLFVADYTAGPETIAAWFLEGAPSDAHPRFYRNLGEGRFREASAELGLVEPSAPMGHNFGDLDNDGFEDVYLGTGWPPYESLMPNLMYRNDRGRRFQDVTYSGGFGHLQKGHGVAFADVDNDGDQDVFEQMGGAFPGDAYPSVLYRNPGHGNAFITLRLEGVRANRSAIGARLRLRVRDPEGGVREIHRRVGSGGSFGASPLRAEIGLGPAGSEILEVEVRWPGSATQRLGPLAANAFYHLREGEAPRRLALTPVALGSSSQ